MKNSLATKSISAFLFYIFSVIRLFAQLGDEDVTFSRIEVSSGLSNSAINCLLQDTRGFLWVGTRDGLNKFDGYSFKTYRNNTDNKFSLIRNDIVNIFEDAQKTIWIATRGGGLHYYEDRLDRFVRMPDFSKDCSILQITEDNEKQLWITGSITTQAFVAQLNPLTKKIKKYLLPFNGSVASLVPESKDEFWIGLRKLGLYKWNKKTNTVYPCVQGDGGVPVAFDILKILKDKYNCLWLATSSGLKRFDITKNQLSDFQYDGSASKELVSRAVLDMVEDRDYLWIGTENGGLVRVNIKTNRCANFTYDKANPFSVSDNSIWSVYKDHQDRIWVGTFSKGLCVYDRLQRKFWPLDITLENDVVNSIMQDHKNRLWIGTEGGVAVKDGTVVKYYQHERGNKSTINNNPVLSIFEDSNKRIWLGTWAGGLNQYDEKHYCFVGYLPNQESATRLSPYNVFTIAEWTKTRQLIVGTYNGLRLLTDYHKPIFEKYYGEREPDNQIQKIFQDSNETIWVGTVEGLNWFDPANGKLSRFLAGPDGSSPVVEFINCIAEDSQKEVWVGSTEGLQLIRDRKFVRRFTSKDGLPSNIVTGILEDNHGKLWLSTTNGISKFDPTRLTFENFTTHDGLLSNEFKPNSCCKGKDGRLYFGGKGIISFIPDSIRKNRTVPPVYFTDFKIFNRSVEVGDKDSILKSHISMTREVHVPYKSDFFSIDFVALNLSASAKNEYAYKLEGFNKDWIYIQNKHTASFTGLSAGTYVLRVKACNNDGIWNEAGASLVICVLPPWWQTWWFRGSVGILVLGTILVIHKIRVEKIKKQNMLLEILVYERTEALNNEREETLMINEQLKEANSEISAQSETIARYNNQLEIMVEERTRDILQLNKKLVEYSFINSHRTRGPLARILGLIYLMKLDRKGGHDEEYLDKLQTSANELDEVVREMNIILDEESPEEKSLAERLSQQDSNIL